MSDAADRVRAALKRYPGMPTALLEEWVRVGAALEIALEALEQQTSSLDASTHDAQRAIERMADALEGR